MVGSNAVRGALERIENRSGGIWDDCGSWDELWDDDGVPFDDWIDQELPD